ncbi:hypothetical protein J4403_04800 [Candidatus Woesearchaeota archaeon]|nr:hypothetical protein [Candidatus Woesearchaeota archaeon]
MKRGQASTFNWIYIAVVGAIILLIFIGFAVKQGAFSDRLLNLKVRDNIDNVISSYRAPYLERTFTLPKDFQINYAKNSLSIDTGEKKVIYNKIIASPSKFKGKAISKNEYEFYVWTYPILLPYQIDNLIILGSSNYGYKMRYDNEEIKNFISPDIPSFVNLNSKEKEIYFTQAEECLTTQNSNLMDIAYTIDNEEIYGYVCNNKEKLPFVGKGMLYSAVFSDDFSSIFNQIVKRIQLVSQLHLEEIKIYSKSCTQYSELTLLIGKIKSFNKNSNPEEILATSRQIEKLNNKMTGRCPSVY